MKIQSIPQNPKLAKKTNGSKPSLSSDAFYLIALALLLKKETGGSSLSHYLYPGNLAITKDKTAA